MCPDAYVRKLMVPLVFATLYVALAAACFPFDTIGRLPDWSHHLSIARNNSITDPRMFSHGLYPGGYPAFLRLSLQGLNLHPLLAGKILSAVSGLFCLMLVIVIARRFGGECAGIWAGLALMSNEVFVTVSSIEGTDGPAAVCQLLALVVVIRNLRNTTIDATTCAIGAGALLGLGYLFRFTSLILVPVFLIFIVAQRTRSKLGFLFILGFVLMASPQLSSSTILRGNPFYNEQVRNVWFALHGNQDWRRYWDLMPSDTTLWGLIAADSSRFFGNWIRGATMFFWSGTGWPTVLPFGALVFMAVKKTMAIRSRLLLSTFTLVPVIVTAMAFCTDRLGLVSILGLSICLGLLFGGVFRSLGHLRGSVSRSVPLLVLLLMLPLSLIVSSWRDTYLRSRATPMENDIDRLVKSLGVERVETVATNLLGMSDMKSAWLKPYSWVGNLIGSDSIRELLDGRDDKDDWQFVVLDYRAFSGDFLPVKLEAEQGGTELVPLAFRDSVGIYMVRPHGIGEAVPDSIAFFAGPTLRAHTWIWNQDNIAVYLFWTTTDSLMEKYQVQVALRLDDGSVSCSHVNVPELGTYPTDAWEPNTIIADFHLLEDTATEDSIAFLEVCLSTIHGCRSDSMDCHVIDRIHRGKRTPLP